MARSVTFNGQTIFVPGGLTRVNADALNQVGGGTGGSVGLIGEAEGGAPGSVSGLVSLRSPSRAADLFGSGPLADAIRLAFQPSGDPLVPGGAAEVVVYKTNASTRSAVTLPSLSTSQVTTTAGGGATTTVIPVAATLVASEHVDRWAAITIAALPGSPTFLRRITANTTSAITVTPALPSAPASGDVVLLRSSLIDVSSRDYGIATNSIDVDVNYSSATESYQVVVDFNGQQQLSPQLGGISRNYLHVLYLGGSVSDSSTVITGSTTSVIQVTAASLVAAAHANETFVLRSASGAFKAAAPVTTNGTGDITLAVPLAEVPEVGDLVELLGVTAASGTVTGASGAATSFDTSITGVAGDNLAIAITSGMTLTQLADAINGNSNYVATVPSQINGDTALASALDFGTATATNLQRSHLTTTSTLGFRQDLQEVVNWMAESAQYITATRSAGGTTDGGKLGATSYDPPFRLSGGSRGISANSDFQAGLDAMLLRVVDEVCPLIDQDLVNEGNGSTATWASVSQQLAGHVASSRGVTRKERGGWIGFRGSKTQIIAAANSLNDFDVALTAQGIRVVDTSGTLVAKGPRELAVAGAGMRLGVTDIGEPLTNKLLRTSGVIQLDSTWDPADPTDSADLILAGVMFAQNIAGRGRTWVRDLTTWVRDDNLAYSEGSVRDVVRDIAYGLRTFLERRFTGRRASPSTVASIRDAAASYLETRRASGSIVDSTDPATGATVRAYHNLQVSSSGDIVTVAVGVFPVPGINFILNDIFLALPTQAA